MSEVEYLDLEDAIALIRMLRVGPLRDLGLLDSAIHRPRSSAFGQDAYVTIELKAAALLHSLVNNHPLVDGNKRLGWLTTVVFAGINGLEPQLTDEQAFDLVWEVASGGLSLEEIAARLDLA